MAFRGCGAVVAAVREAVESRRGRRLRRHCCAANLPLGPWCPRGSACAGSAAVGHSRLLAEGTKEEEKREEDVAVLGFGAEGEETTEGQLAGQIASPKPSCSCQLLSVNGRRPSAPPAPAPSAQRLGKAGRDRGGEAVSVLAPDCCAVFLEPF